MRRVVAILAFLLAAAAAGAGDDRDGVVLLVNRAVPESRALAELYCQLRGLPLERICELELPLDEQISREDYERLLRDPLLDWLRREGWIDQIKRDPRRVRSHESGWVTVKSRLRILCSFYGVPIHIRDTRPWLLEKIRNLLTRSPQRDEAAVDSELALLLHSPYDIEGRIGNPCFGQLRWDHSAASGFVILAARLDGPDPDVVERMMRDAVDAERNGLHGRMYFDLRQAASDEYKLGDFWITEAAERFSREGYDVVIERTELLFREIDPMDHAALYLGWYAPHVTGPFARTGFAFRPGAIANHLHSFNAARLRTYTNHWVGPLLAAGAAATWGSVSEPFLGATPHLPIFADRLCRGATFAESVYLSLPFLSWQITVIGDPLYRPFATPPDEQARNLETAGRLEELAWVELRKINRLVREGRLLIALDQARAALRQRENAPLHEKVASLLATNGLIDESIPHYERALELATDAGEALRIGSDYLAHLRAAGQDSLAEGVETRLRERWQNSPFLGLLEPDGR